MRKQISAFIITLVAFSAAHASAICLNGLKVAVNNNREVIQVISISDNHVRATLNGELNYTRLTDVENNPSAVKLAMEVTRQLEPGQGSGLVESYEVIIDVVNGNKILAAYQIFESDIDFGNVYDKTPVAFELLDRGSCQ
jgi:hypothetical protein